MRTVVIGGGISGLTAAWRLRAHGAPGDEVTLLEARPHTGGHARTLCEDGFRVEAGPNGFLARATEPGPLALVAELGLSPSLLNAGPAARRRYILHRARLRRVPMSPPALLASDLLSLRGKLRLLGEAFVGRAPAGAEESVYEFARRRVGREAADVLIDTAISGISAGDSRALAVDAAFPLMRELERDHGSLIRGMIALRRTPPRLVSFTGGLAEMTDALAGRLGSTVRVAVPVRGLVQAGCGWRVTLESGETLAADRVVLAIPAPDAARLLAPVDPEAARPLAAIPYAGLAVVALAFRTADLARRLEGYGYLVARSEGFATLGVVWESAVFGGRAPADHVLLRVMLGGARNPAISQLDETELTRLARRELARGMGIGAAPARVWVWPWPRAIPQYTRGHLERVREARAHAARLSGLELCGSAYDGISFGAAIVSAERAASRLLHPQDANGTAIGAGP